MSSRILNKKHTTKKQPASAYPRRFVQVPVQLQDCLTQRLILSLHHLVGDLVVEHAAIRRARARLASAAVAVGLDEGPALGDGRLGHAPLDTRPAE